MNLEEDAVSATEEMIRRLALDQTGPLLARLTAIRERPGLPTAAARLLDDDSPDVRAMALLALTGSAAAGVREVARRGLRDSTAPVRVQAVHVLRGLGTEALDDLATALQDDDPHVLVAAATAVMALGGDREPAPAVLRGLLASPDETQRRAALALIGRRRVTELTDAAVTGLRDPVPRVRFEAVRALAALGGQASQQLLAVLGDDGPEVRAAALRALASVDETGADTIAGLLTDPVAQVRALAVDALVRLDSRRCAGVLPLVDDPAAVVRRAAVAALGRWRCPQTGAVLLRTALGAQDEDERLQAVTALVELGWRPQEPAQLRMLSDTQASVRAQAVKLAGDGRDVAARLREILLTDPSANVRRAAAAAGRAVTAAVPQALRDDPDPTVRVAALRALAPEALSAATDALADPDADVRATAVRLFALALDRLDATTNQATTEALRRRMSVEDDDRVRAELLRAIDPPPDGPARPLYDPAGSGSPFTAWLRDPDWYPASASLTFFNTGVLRVVDEDDGEIRYAYEVHDGHLKLTRDGQDAHDTAFEIAAVDRGFALTLRPGPAADQPVTYYY